MIHDDSVKRTRWKTRRVVKLNPGTDGKVRRVNLLIADKYIGVGSIVISRNLKCL